jgi:hypothetical protein
VARDVPDPVALNDSWGAESEAEASIELPPDVTGCATVIFESRDPVATVAVTTLRVDLTS